MPQKQITDLDAATSFDNGDLLLLRKTGEGVDKKINQQTFIKSFGNPSITGFVATSSAPNQITLLSSNVVDVDEYRVGMIVTFISPINSTGIVNIQIGSLTLRTLQLLGTATTSTLVIGGFYQAIYLGADEANGSFYQTNVASSSIFTNEYGAVGVVAPDELSTTYTLTTAIGITKPSYYNNMSIIFTSDIDSKGAVLINVDGLGIKTLSDPVGDDIPFSLSEHEAVLAIYDGTVFRKHIFSSIEPAPDPIDPPDDIIVNVGPSRSIKTITAAIAQLVRDFGEVGQGRAASIKLDSDYVDNGLTIKVNSPWITVVTAVGGNTFSGTINIESPGNINFKGIFNTAPALTKFLTVNSFANQGVSNARCTFTNSTINCTNVTDTTYTTCFEMISQEGTSINNASIFQNVNINGFHILFTDSNTSKTSVGNFRYSDGTVVMKNTSPAINRSVIQSFANVTLSNINFGDVTRTGGQQLIFCAKALFLTNVNMTTGANATIVNLGRIGNDQNVITNCVLRNTTSSTTPAIVAEAPLIIDGGDFRHASSSSPDIFAADFAGAVIRLRNNPLGVTGKTGKGQIINE